MGLLLVFELFLVVCVDVLLVFHSFLFVFY